MRTFVRIGSLLFVLPGLLQGYVRATDRVETEYMDRALHHARAGRPDSASFHLDKALDLALGSNDKRLWARYVHDVGKIYRSGYPGRAVAHYDHYLKQAIIRFGDTDTVTAELYARIGDIYRSPPVGKYYQSLRYFEQALHIFRQHGIENSFVGFICHFAGTTYTRTGSYEMARGHLKQAIRIRLSLRDSLRASQSYNNLGLVYQDRGQFGLATGCYDRGLDLIAFQTGEKTQRQRAALWLNKAECFLLAGKHEEAAGPLQQATAIFEKYDDPYGKSASYRAMAKQRDRHGKGADALLYYNKALAMAMQAHGETHRETAKIHIDLGNWHITRKNTDEALHHYQKALHSLMPETRDAAMQPEIDRKHLYPEPWIMIALKQRAMAFRQIYRTTRDPQYLERAMYDLELAVAEMDLLRDSYTYEKDKELLFSDDHEVLAHAIGTAIELALLNGDPGYSNTVFRLMEKNKARSLLELFRGVEAKKRSGLPDSLIDRERSLKVEMELLRKEIHESRQRHGSTPPELDHRLALATSAFEGLFHHLKHHYISYHHIKYADEAMTIADVQRTLLTLRSALLEYTLLDSALYLLVITKNDHKVVSLPVDTSFYTATGAVLQTISSADFITRPAAAFDVFTKNAHHLYKLLIAPAEDLLANGANSIDELIIVPDGKLNYLPFEILLKTHEQGSEVNYRSLAYLVKDYRIHYAYSSATLAHQGEGRRQDGERPGMIAFAPVFDSPGQRGGKKAWPPLRHSLEEVTHVSGLMKGEVRVRNAATGRCFKEEAPGYAIIHLATHTVINDEFPLHSALIFSPEGETGDEGRLYAYELFNINLQADLAVLSACNTGSGKLVNGEGIMSLARAFAYAGCPSVVMSLWQVNDFSTSAIMQGFYEELKFGTKKSEALRQAKLRYLSKADAMKSHPFFWAGFVLQGNESATAFTQKPSYTALVILAGLLTLPLAWYLMRRLKRKTCSLRRP